MAINKLFRLLKSEQGKGFLNNFAVAAIFAGIGELASQRKEERTIERDNTILMALKDLSLTTADIVRHVRQSEERILNKNQPLKILGGADHLEAQKRLKVLYLIRFFFFYFPPFWVVFFSPIFHPFGLYYLKLCFY